MAGAVVARDAGNDLALLRGAGALAGRRDPGGPGHPGGGQRRRRRFSLARAAGVGGERHHRDRERLGGDRQRHAVSADDGAGPAGQQRRPAARSRRSRRRRRGRQARRAQGGERHRRHPAERQLRDQGRGSAQLPRRQRGRGCGSRPASAEPAYPITSARRPSVPTPRHLRCWWNVGNRRGWRRAELLIAGRRSCTWITWLLDERANASAHDRSSMSLRPHAGRVAARYAFLESGGRSGGVCGSILPTVRPCWQLLDSARSSSSTAAKGGRLDAADTMARPGAAPSPNACPNKRLAAGS